MPTNRRVYSLFGASHTLITCYECRPPGRFSFNNAKRVLKLCSPYAFHDEKRILFPAHCCNKTWLMSACFRVYFDVKIVEEIIVENNSIERSKVVDDADCLTFKYHSFKVSNSKSKFQ